MSLLSPALAEEIRCFDSDPGPFDINDTGLLSAGELDAVAASVWGEQH